MNIQAPGISVEIVKTDRRKTASIYVKEGKVRILVPKNISKERIESLLKSKSRWIQSKIKEQSIPLPYKEREAVSGEYFSYLGINYCLMIIGGVIEGVKFANGYISVTVKDSSDHKQIKSLLRCWYIDRAKEQLLIRIAYYGEKLDLTPTSVIVRDFKSRWGSCHSNGQLKFNWRIILAPHNVLDYLVVHELIHLKIPNHSPKYWKVVESIMPDFVAAKNWLRTNGRTLNL